MEVLIIAAVLVILGVPFILCGASIAHSLRRIADGRAPMEPQEADEDAPEGAAKTSAETKPAPEPAKEGGDDDGDDYPIIAKLKKRGFVCWVEEEPPPGRVGIGDLRFELSSDPDDADTPQLFCPTCANPMFDFAEAIERKKGEDEPRWCDYGSTCLFCGFYFEDESSGYTGFFGPLIEECYDFNEIFQLLDEEDVTEQRKLLARREAAAMKQLLTVRSQRKALEKGPVKEKPAVIRKFEKPPEPPPPDKKDADPA